jgi:hypothetical protein
VTQNVGSWGWSDGETQPVSPAAAPTPNAEKVGYQGQHDWPHSEATCGRCRWLRSRNPQYRYNWPPPPTEINSWPGMER